MVALGRVRRHLGRAVDRAEEQPGAEIAADQIGMLALPAEACGRGERLLHHRRGIDEDFQRRAGCLAEPATDGLEARLDHVVIVVAPRIDRDEAAGPVGEVVEGIARRPVIEAEHDHAAHLGPQHARIGPLLGAGLHPSHRAVPAFGQKACQASGRRSDRIGPRQPDGVEAFGPAAVDDGVPELRAAQKSRSA